jgi:hypothetical protein
MQADSIGQKPGEPTTSWHTSLEFLTLQLFKAVLPLETQEVQDMVRKIDSGNQQPGATMFAMTTA